jgi:glyoxylase-like metal-dependent hydrolase (beta-lactamase superfamily II)
LRVDPGAVPEPGRPVALSRRVVRLTAPNPGLMTGPGTNSYLVGPDGGDSSPVGTTGAVVVDPGPDDAGHLRALADLGGGRIRWILVTHTHPDHAPGAAGLAALTGAEVLGYGPGDGFAPDRTVSDGFTLAGPGFSLRAVHTPGHASDHLCWFLTDERMLFSGDHLMGGSTVVIAPPDGDMAVYLESLRRLRTLVPPVATIAPGHGPLLVDPAATVDAVVAHRLAREEAVVAALRAAALRAAGALRTAGAPGTAAGVTVDDLLPVVYADVADELLPVARKSLWAHLRKLADDGRARSTDAD